MPESEQQNFEFQVKMTCGGCSGAVTRVLKKQVELGKLSTFDVNLETQKVTATGMISLEDLREVIAKTGKQVIKGEVVTSSPPSVGAEGAETDAEVAVVAV